MKRKTYISSIRQEILLVTIRRLCFAVLILLYIPGEVAAQWTSDFMGQGRWDLSRSPMPECRQLHASFVFDNKIFILGGFQSVKRAYDVIYNTLLVYDPEQDAWDSTHYQTPIKRVGPGTIVVDQKVFVLGGFAADANQILYSYNSVDVFDPVEGTWQSRANFPGDKIGALCRYGTNIYSIGGIDSYYQPKKNCYVYDTANDRWERIADMVLPRAGHAVVPLNGMIYAIGGIFEHPTGTAEVEIYDPGTDSWTAGPPLPFPLCDMTGSTVSHRDEIIILGGRHAIGPATPLRCMLRFSGTTNTWSVVDSLPASRSQHTAEIIDGSIYMFGGYEEEFGKAENNTWVYHLDITGQKESQGTGFRLWPNPVSDFLVVSGGGSGYREIQLFSISGKLLVKKMVTGPRVELDMRNYPGGVYLLRMHSGGQYYYGKVLKK